MHISVPATILIAFFSTAAAPWEGHIPHAAAATPATTFDAEGVNIDSGGAGDESFIADSYYTGGLTANNDGRTGNPNFPRAVAHPIPVNDWNTYRYLENSYQIPALTPGASYQVRLYFLEWYWSKVGQRVFGVAINAATVLQDFDIIQAAVNVGGDGSHQGVEKDFTATADANGTITISFIRGSADQPMVNAISVVPSSP